MRKCIHCSFEGEDEKFVRQGSGYRNTCKICKNKYNAEWDSRNKEKRAESIHRTYAKKVGKHPDECRGIKLTEEQRLANKKSGKRKHYVKYREKILQKAKEHGQKNRDRISAYHKEWRKKNKEYKAEQDRAWRQANPAKVNLYSNSRRSRKLQAMPKWLSAIELAQIQEMYDIAQALSVQTGIEHHVDHIHPLHGKSFNGLHVPWNLQVLPNTENLSKGQSLPESDKFMLWGAA